MRCSSTWHCCWRDADRVGEVGAGETLPGAELEQQLVACAEPARRLADEVGELGALDLGAFEFGIVGALISGIPERSRSVARTWDRLPDRR